MANISTTLFPPLAYLFYSQICGNKAWLQFVSEMGADVILLLVYIKNKLEEQVGKFHRMWLVNFK